jgi:P2-related tail formation protein
MAGDLPPSRSSYLDRLPAFVQDGETPGDDAFLARFLLAFEHVLSGIGNVDDPGLEELLDGATGSTTGRTLTGIERFFDAGLRPGGAVLPPEQRAPAEFLEWLARWVGVALRPYMSEPQRREMIARAVPLYRKRGTRDGLAQLLSIQSSLRATITDASTPPRPGAPDVSKQGPHFFHVQVSLPQGSIDQIRRQREILVEILDAEKPAHTWYRLDVATPELQIGKTSHIGVDTLIGKPRYNP